MGTSKTKGITPSSPQRFLVDAGAVWLDYGLPTERLLGATRGGNVFSITQNIREMPMDGARGPVKGAERIIESKATLVANLIEITADNIVLMIPAAKKTDYPSSIGKTHDSITRDADIVDANYITNIALVGKVQGALEDFIGLLYNALPTSNVDFKTVDKDEAVVAVTFTAHFDPNDMDTEPWEIRSPLIVAGT